MTTIVNSTINVSLGEIKISNDPNVILACYGLGSCIGISAYDKISKIGALAHVVLPNNKNSLTESSPAKYANTAIPHMIQEMRKMGVRKEGLTINIAGGAKILSCIPAGSMLDIGEKNVVAVLEALSKQNLKVNNKDVRGNIGRTLFLHISNGKTTVKTAMNQLMEL
jgi:chemotaxis protein CheD